MAKKANLSVGDAVDRLSGIGPRLRDVLAGEGYRSIQDLLFHLPSRYEDRTRALPLSSLQEPDVWVLVRATVERVRERRAHTRRMGVVEAVLRDDSGTLPVVWFNQPWVAQHARGEPTMFLYGPLRRGRGGGLQLVNPEMEEAGAADEAKGIVPVYPKIGPLGGRRLRRIIGQGISLLSQVEDPLPEGTRRDLGMPSFAAALAAVHQPVPPADPGEVENELRRLDGRRTAGHLRLAFDELLAFCCTVARYRVRRLSQVATRCGSAGRRSRAAAGMFPFELTAAQERVSGEIARDLARGFPMARLLQGDVGSGKTAVAAIALRVVLESGHQAAIMAPTEILAEQHHQTLGSVLAGTPFEPELLVSSLPAGERRRVLSGLADGAVRLVVGTHALLQESVRFEDLCLAVVDEQHRFGVAQREALLGKGKAPHLLVMTATPIPRSLALTVYGDLDVSVIEELPPGRQEVVTVVRPVSARPRLYEFVHREVSDGGRAYIVFPSIDPGDHDARCLTECEPEVRDALAGHGLGVLHGRMARAERESVYAAFKSGEVQVLLATTVVEVGVDVPEATIMVIESPERFGLSQLHQLRGRVGRGARRSWCILLVDEHVSLEARRRLNALCRSDDGFAIAETDLRLRGPGEMTGTRQWGPSQFRFADLVRHRELVAQARELADELAAAGELEEIGKRLGRYHPIDASLPTG